MLEAPARTVGGSGGSLPPPGLPALASLGLRSRLSSESRAATVLGASTGFAWCALDDEAVLLGSPDAVRFPNAILANGWDSLEPGEEILIGSGSVLGPGLGWRVVRWWDPRVTPIDTTRHEVMARVSSVVRTLESPALGLEAALVDGDRRGVIDAAREMLGKGRGLTPEGDDRLVGVFAAYRHVTASLGRPAGTALLDDLAGALLSVASTKTTLLSVTLLRHALAGEVPDPVADLLRAVAGRGSTAAALERCFSVGDSSGRAFAHGVVCGARAGCQVAP